mmetsp:Transcript_5399/g.6144  ORF Transcript_5399/g.6144 Transcript_5399/m.6144 type:complete len:177 (+) Transcript_5399:16-546(+)
MISKVFLNRQLSRSVRGIYKPALMMTQTKFNFLTYNKFSNNTYKLALNSRSFSTSKDYPLMDTLEDISEFETKVVQNEKLVILQAAADWCRPCQALKIKMQKAIEAHPKKDQISWIQFDIDQHKELAEMLDVQSVPTVYSVKGGELIERIIGTPDNDEGITEFIDLSVKKVESTDL